ncbi:MAG: Tetratricopeptide 2 repeat protein [Pedosphaera sp.]|nr:Tetratricopeptide 2 repeat protein [Pedosphaera sp.]
MDSHPDQRRIRWIYPVLILGTFAIFISSLNHQFITFDDPEYVTANPHVQSGLTWDGLVYAFTTGDNSNWHPLTWLSYMLDYNLHGLNPSGYHLTNLLFHIVNALLLFGVLRLMTGAIWRSAFVAALFAWHPLHVESVAWVAERKDVLSAFFWLLTMFAYARYAQKPDKRRYQLTLLLFACGLMAKPMVVTLPFVLLLLDFWPLKRFSNSFLQPTLPENDGSKLTGTVSAQPRPLSRLFMEKIPFFALSLAASVITFVVQKKGGAVTPLDFIPVHQRAANIPISYVRYLRKMIWPADLAVFYPFHTWPVWQAVAAGLFLLILSFVAVAMVRRRPFVTVGWFWFIGTLVPVIGLVQVGSQSLADRYTYLPLIGIFILLVWGGYEAASQFRVPRPVMAGISCLILFACLVLTGLQLQTWKNSISLFGHALAVAGESSIGNNNFGLALSDAGKTDEALALFNRSLLIQPNNAVTYYDIGMIYEGRQDYQTAIEYFNKALHINPQYAQVHYSMGNVLAFQGKFPGAAEEYTRAVQIDPTSLEMNYNLGVMLLKLDQPREAVDYFKTALRINSKYAPAWHQLGVAYDILGNTDGAIRDYKEALRLKPDLIQSCLKLGMLLAREGNYSEAEKHFGQAIKLEPTNNAARFNLAATFEANNQLDQAVAEFSEVIRLKSDDFNARRRLAGLQTRQQKFDAAIQTLRDSLRLQPDSSETLANLAWLLATCSKPELRNGPEAVQLAERAFKLGTQNDLRFLTVLDASYAQAGRFDEAIKTAQKLQELAVSAKQTAMAENAGKRLELYRAGKTYHQ